MARKIGIKDIENLSVGAAILGTGGGGDPYIGKLMAIDAIKKHGEVNLISPEEVPDSECVIPTGMMGAPTILIEKVPNGNEIMEALQILEKYINIWKTSSNILKSILPNMKQYIPKYFSLLSMVDMLFSSLMFWLFVCLQFSL